jgi:pimeloyl-ACP methyl ester carboxylesterase
MSLLLMRLPDSLDLETVFQTAQEQEPPFLSQSSAFRSRFFTAADGLRLHMRDYGPRAANTLPVVCLPGLARTAADFDSLASSLGTSRRVVALDYRGRGLSERDRNWKNYDIRVENGDILDILTAAGIDGAIFVGTSRGGLHILTLAATRPTLLRGAVLNDIGPVIEAKGLMRIRGYVGTLPQPSSWTDAIDLLKATASAQFTALDKADWDAYARSTFEERKGHFVLQYDPMLKKGLEALDLETALPDLWPLFDCLRDIPMLVIRGENSDLLAPATVEEMLRRHPGAEFHSVPGQGHAPLLRDRATIERIAHFVHKVSG